MTSYFEGLYSKIIAIGALATNHKKKLKNNSASAVLRQYVVLILQRLSKEGRCNFLFSISMSKLHFIILSCTNKLFLIGVRPLGCGKNQEHANF